MSRNSGSAKEIFLAALKLAPDQWAAYLDEACGPDDELRARVGNLLQAHEEHGSFLQAASDGMLTTDGPAPDRPGTVIGPYKLLQQIGEGGMGTVYMAEQEQPVRRKVALKIIKPGMDSRQVVARFEAERQALAMMDHQNIARVLDAGTTASGRPYFVMELVHGVSITRFCDERKLTPNERLELFVPICQAIQHAHQKGIIHRDIKPSNVLVTMYDDRPVPKVIDFGVAKAVEQRLTERTMFTQFGTLVGTFEYMSPEQAEMNAFGVDTRSDIYSLGVLLYELLTGTTPLEQKRLKQAALDEMVRLIKEEEAPRPSARLSSSNNLPKIAAARNTEPEQLSRLVRGEIDWIVMKCLEKDRALRYETANGLARDIQRYLADEPVEACPPSAAYRLRKFARKYKTPLRVAAAFLLLLVLGAIASAWQAVRATLAERNAREQGAIALDHEREAIQAREETAQERNHVAAINHTLERALTDLRQTLYVSDINRAYQFWDEGNVQRVEEILERHQSRGTDTDLRGVEWHYLHRLCSRFQTGRVFDAKSAILAMALSPDGKNLAISGMDNSLHCLDATTGAVRFTVPIASGSRLAFSADGRTLVSTTNAGAGEGASRSANVVVRFWDVTSGTEKSEAQKQLQTGELGQHELSRDGATLIGFADDTKLQLWNTTTAQETVTLDASAADPSITKAYMHLTALAPDGKTLVWQLGPTTMVWDLTTRKLQFKHYVAHPWSFAVALSPNGKLLACHRGGPPHVVQLWDWKASTKLAELTGFQGHVHALAFSPDGKILAAGDEFAKIRLWDVTTFREIATFKGHGGGINALAFAPDGQWLYSAASDGLVRRWKPTPDSDPDTIEGDISLYPARIGFSADSKTMFMASNPKAAENRFEVKHWDLASRRELSHFQGAQRGLGVSARGELVVLGHTGDRSAQLWDVRANRMVANLEGSPWRLGKARFSPDSRWLAVIEPDRIILRDTQTGNVQRSVALVDANSVAFSPDSRMLVASTGSTEAGDAVVKVWEADTLSPLTEFPGSARSFIFSQEGNLLALINYDAVTIWDVRARQVRVRLKLDESTTRGREFFIFSLGCAFSPDGKLFCAGVDVVVHVWDTGTGERLWTLKGHRDLVRVVAWSPDGKTLATASGPIVKLWNFTTGEELTTLVASNGIYFLQFAPDGSLAVADAVNSVRVWRVGQDR